MASPGLMSERHERHLSRNPSHLHRWAGETIGRDWHVYRMEYGALRSVYASTACNYSYREFWF